MRKKIGFEYTVGFPFDGIILNHFNKQISVTLNLFEDYSEIWQGIGKSNTLTPLRSVTNFASPFKIFQRHIWPIFL